MAIAVIDKKLLYAPRIKAKKYRSTIAGRVGSHEMGEGLDDAGPARDMTD